MSLKKNARLVPVCVFLLLPFLGLLTGCGTIRGKPPVYNRNPGSFEMVTAPKPPKHVDTGHLIKKITDAPALGDLTKIDSTSDDPNIIYYPRLYLQEQEDVVVTPAVANSEKTSNHDDIRTLLDKQSFIAVLDLKNESAQAAASGRLAADFIYRAIFRLSDDEFRIIDNEEAFRRAKKDLVNPEEFDLSPEALYSQIGKFQYPTFWITGAVTSYSVENKELEFQYVVKTNSTEYIKFANDINKWRHEYSRYLNWYKNSYTPAYDQYLLEFNKREKELGSRYRGYERSYNAYSTEYHDTYTPEYRRYVASLNTKATLSNILFLPLHVGLEIITFGAADTWTRAAPYPRVKLEPQRQVPSIGFPAQRNQVLDLRNRLPARIDSDSVLQVMRHRGRVPPPVRRMATVCNIGITLRLVGGIKNDQAVPDPEIFIGDGLDSGGDGDEEAAPAPKEPNFLAEILWIGNGSIRHVDIQQGMKEVCDNLAVEIWQLFDDKGHSSTR